MTHPANVRLLSERSGGRLVKGVSDPHDHLRQLGESPMPRPLAYHAINIVMLKRLGETSCA